MPILAAGWPILKATFTKEFAMAFPQTINTLLKPLLSIMVCLGILGLWPARATAEEIVRMAIGDWPPYTSESNAQAKLVEKIVGEAFRLEGVKVVNEYFPWKRSYVYVQTGQYDATYPWNRTPEREAEFIINKIPLVKDEGVFFHLKTTPFDWRDWTDLKHYRLGVTLGYKQEIEYKEKGLQTEVSPTAEINFKRLLAGRIDAYQTSKVVGYGIIRELFSPEEQKRFTHHPKAVETNVYYVMFSRKTPNGEQMAAKLDRGLKKLKDSGAYVRIVAEYLGSGAD
ncbi:substrate-binding periplasmic protein [Leeia aquatica]|uniref:ABC transporter substrate-binding protein n=1 Tax=Leeia aquatica TaxID=2725557 RepID=A0A847RX87_9NEIS|nr:ABC transporter substrate-binding protein [Leeia aquatica]NLR75770.1 ABC transporter substrate-binding protein [Leeia aquatica]